MKRFVAAAWMACAFMAGWLLREPQPPHLPSSFLLSSHLLSAQSSSLLPDGGLYTGPLQNGLMHGNGEIRWPDGGFYQGEFVAGLYDGQGVLEYPDGSRYEGEWREGEFISASADDTVTAADRRLEQALYSEQARLQQQLDALQPGKPGTPELYFLGIAGDGTQRVFGREIDFVHQQLQQRYALQGHSLLLINDRERTGDAVMATRTSLQAALQRLAHTMNTDEDILLLYMTSHGSENHDFILEQEGLLLPDLPVQTLRELLDNAGIRWQVVIVSACYSGGAVPLLQHADRLVMTSAAADRSSFGCTDDAELTYFGRALFAEAFPRHVNWQEQFTAARQWIEQKEKAEDITPSLPQIAVGDNIRQQLARIPLQGDGHDRP